MFTTSYKKGKKQLEKIRCSKKQNSKNEIMYISYKIRISNCSTTEELCYREFSENRERNHL